MGYGAERERIREMAESGDTSVTDGAERERWEGETAVLGFRSDQRMAGGGAD